MKISFCTTCMGRLHHLKETLPQNIRDNLPRAGSDDPQVEFVVLDYNSKDGLEEWIKNDPEMVHHMTTGTLVYAKTREPEFFHHAHAKNMAHRLGSGDVLCNVDADNFTGPRFANFLADIFEDDRDVIVHPAFQRVKEKPLEERGFYGRIAMTRDSFFNLGGYNENRFKGWGTEDTHFMLRGYALGLKPVSIFDQEFFKVICHTHQERFANAASKDVSLANIRRCSSGNLWDRIEAKLNRAYVAFSMAQSNRDGDFGTGTVEVGLNGDMVKMQPVAQTAIKLRFAFNGISTYKETRLHTPQGDEPNSAHAPA